MSQNNEINVIEKAHEFVRAFDAYQEVLIKHYKDKEVLQAGLDTYNNVVKSICALDINTDPLFIETVEELRKIK
jgi:hypothetical protein